MRYVQRVSVSMWELIRGMLPYLSLLEDAEMRDMRAGVVVWIWTGLGLE
jgi:hypothetical protein